MKLTVPWRTCIYILVAVYLLLDLKVFNGPLRRQLFKSRTSSTVTREQALKRGWVAIVNGEAITEQQLQLGVARWTYQRGEEFENLDATLKLQTRRAALRSLIDETLIRQYADGHNWNAPKKEIDAFIKQWESQFADQDEISERSGWQQYTKEQRDRELARIWSRRRWLEERIKPGIGVSDEDLRQWFEDSKQQQLEGVVDDEISEHPSVFEPEKVRARHIFVSHLVGEGEDQDQPEKTIRLAHQRLLDGEDFAVVAKELSQDQRTRNRGGELNWFSRRRVSNGFTEKVFSQPTGELGEPFETEIGWYLVQVLERKAERLVEFEEVREEILIFLTNEQRKDAVDLLLGKLRKTGNIKLIVENL